MKEDLVAVDCGDRCFLPYVDYRPGAEAFKDDRELIAWCKQVYYRTRTIGHIKVAHIE